MADARSTLVDGLAEHIDVPTLHIRRSRVRARAGGGGGSWDR